MEPQRWVTLVAEDGMSAIKSQLRIREHMREHIREHIGQTGGTERVK